jgi:hypothetical protein
VFLFKYKWFDLNEKDEYQQRLFYSPTIKQLRFLALERTFRVIGGKTIEDYHL